MGQLGVISKVKEPTEWCSGIVVVPSQMERSDLRRFDQAQPEYLLGAPYPSIYGADSSSDQRSKDLLKLDANSGFWQVELAPKSTLLTTFITPVGRFCFKRIPFGITSVLEHFQQRLSDILCGLEGVVCLVDDILVFIETQIEYDNYLFQVLR